MGGIRVVEVLAALSLTTDLASGVSFEKGLRTCAVATAFGRELGLPQDELSVVFHTALVRAIGRTSHASENADFFEDDIAFQGWLKEIDLADEEVLSRQLARFGAWAPGRQAAMIKVFVASAPVAGTSAWRSACEVGRAVGPLLGLPDAVVTALDHVYERWDGRGMPGIAREDSSAASWRPLGCCTTSAGRASRVRRAHPVRSHRRQPPGPYLRQDRPPDPGRGGRVRHRGRPAPGRGGGNPALEMSRTTHPRLRPRTHAGCHG